MNIQLLIHGVSARLTTNDEHFLAYAAQHLHPFITKEAVEGSIQITISFIKRQRTEMYSPHLLGSDIGWDSKNNTLYIQKSNFETRLTTTTPWHIEVLADQHTDIWGRHKAQETLYRTLFEQVLAPSMCMQLALRWNIASLSGAAFKINGRVHLLITPPGELRAALCARLKKELKAEIVSESIVLTDGERLFPFTQDPECIVSPQTISSIILATAGEAFVRYDLPREQAYQSIKAINNLYAETAEYSPYAALILVDPTRWQFLLDQDNETLKKLCERHPCSRVIIDESIDSLRQLVQ